MDMTEALPDRMQVTVRGTPGPVNAMYYVLDYMNDLEARVALRGLVRSYRSLGRHVVADELEKALDESDRDVRAWVIARNEVVKTRGSKKFKPTA